MEGIVLAYTHTQRPRAGTLGRAPEALGSPPPLHCFEGATALCEKGPVVAMQCQGLHPHRLAQRFNILERSLKDEVEAIHDQVRSTLPTTVNNEDEEGVSAARRSAVCSASCGSDWLHCECLMPSPLRTLWMSPGGVLCPLSPTSDGLWCSRSP